MSVLILRLKDGMDIICNQFIDEYEKEITHISDPMIFEIRGANLILQHWLPIGVIKNNSTSLKREDILCILEPSDELVEYYESMIVKMNEISENFKENLNNTDKEIINVAEALEELASKNTTIH